MFLNEEFLLCAPRSPTYICPWMEARDFQVNQALLMASGSLACPGVRAAFEAQLCHQPALTGALGLNFCNWKMYKYLYKYAFLYTYVYYMKN